MQQLYKRLLVIDQEIMAICQLKHPISHTVMIRYEHIVKEKSEILQKLKLNG